MQSFGVHAKDIRHHSNGRCDGDGRFSKAYCLETKHPPPHLPSSSSSSSTTSTTSRPPTTLYSTPRSRHSVNAAPFFLYILRITRRRQNGSMLWANRIGEHDCSINEHYQWVWMNHWMLRLSDVVFFFTPFGRLFFYFFSLSNDPSLHAGWLWRLWRTRRTLILQHGRWHIQQNLGRQDRATTEDSHETNPVVHYQDPPSYQVLLRVLLFFEARPLLQLPPPPHFRFPLSGTNTPPIGAAPSSAALAPF